MIYLPDYLFEGGTSLTTQALSSSAGATNGTGIDISNTEMALGVHVCAPVASTGDTITFTVEHSYDNSTFAAVPAANLVNSVGTASTFTVVTDAVAVNQWLYLKRDGLRRYVRIVATTAGATITALVFGEIIAFEKYTQR